MTDMTPAQIARKLNIPQYSKLCAKVEQDFKQKFGVLSIQGTPEGIKVIVELDDKTRHTVTL